MIKVVLFFLTLYILVVLAFFSVAKNREHSALITVPEKIEIIYDKGIEYWCGKDTCQRANPLA